MNSVQMNLVRRLHEMASAILYASEAVQIDVVLERIAHIAKEVAGTRYAALGIPDGDGGLRHFKTAGMTQEEIAMLDHPPHGHGLLGAIMSERRTIRLENMRDDKRSVGFPKHHPHMTSFLGVPIQMGAQLFGMLYLSDKANDEPFNDLDELALETLATYAALAISSATLNDQQGRLHLLEERERIGMELHDGIIQSLYSIGMQIELLRLNGGAQPSDLAPVVGYLNDVIDDIRGYILELRTRGDRKLTTRQYLERIPQRLNLPLNVAVEIVAPDAKPPFTPATFESICLIVNEAFSNAARHSGASAITISAWQEGAHFHICVQDDGQGFDVEEVVSRSSGLGLHNMQKRARLYGGDVTVDSHLNEGTCLTIRIPIRPT